MDANDLILVSVDDHVIEPRDMFDRHLPARYRDRAPRVVDTEDGSEAWEFAGQRIVTFGLNAVAGTPPEEYGIVLVAASVTSRLDGKVALITGTGGGQGRAAALAFTGAGATVVGCDLDAAAGEETVKLVEAAGGAITASHPVDLGDPDAARGWVEGAADRHGRIDIDYNNASAARFGPIDQMSIEDWQFTVRNELDLVFYVTKFAWPHLARQGGVVLNTASIAGLTASVKTPTAAHSATKGAVIALTRQLAAEGAPHGIRAVSISPGPVESPGTAELFADPELRAALSADALLGRIGRPEDVARTALFLASDDAAYITGTDIVVDGGVTAASC